MLSSRARLKSRESSKGDALPREGYLMQLMAECTSPSTTPPAKQQCLAHLANFGYDPINFEYFLRLNVVDMFVDFVDDGLPHASATPQGAASNHAIVIVRLAVQGICNVSADPRFQKILVENDAIPLLVRAAHSHDATTCAAALSTLFFLLDAPVEVIPVASLRENESIVGLMKKSTLHQDTIVRNTAFAFLTRRNDIAEDEGG
ncbi:Aste57867_18690 [Aphanomyces stellatus]|uniref:Aste57867_18690 protein n=1 Tax=Aphanomyces stellatus TaxID=120398 RepID=A0A485LBC7_9STRA|nr:hypothetical protein As57867_018628 [Aphanomyces stellatus]VFT95425.1 Aste57867_18690 [Aphanomyces stellatus]